MKSKNNKSISIISKSIFWSTLVVMIIWEANSTISMADITCWLTLSLGLPACFRAYDSIDIGK
ncbi:hypothetical protein [uncultured Clostridium sp.]|uniref:hypothetical protein n=1 Tax=uncultured Clostridium sp. TaxID=59620 RepID=UPI0026F3E2A0|nr:hypothetical protein [uncultured Clostridium sp.]